MIKLPLWRGATLLMTIDVKLDWDTPPATAKDAADRAYLERFTAEAVAKWQAHLQVEAEGRMAVLRALLESLYTEPVGPHETRH